LQNIKLLAFKSNLLKPAKIIIIKKRAKINGNFILFSRSDARREISVSGKC